MGLERECKLHVRGKTISEKRSWNRTIFSFEGRNGSRLCCEISPTSGLRTEY